MIRCVVIIRITNQIIHENYWSSIRSENLHIIVIVINIKRSVAAENVAAGLL